MGKASKQKTDTMVRELCSHEGCSQYIEWLEQRVSELEFQLGLRDKQITDPFELKEIMRNSYEIYTRT